MTRLLLPFLLLFTVSLLSADPVQVMEGFIDAVYRYDAETVFRMLSAENQASLSMMITMAKMQPAQAAEQISRWTGRQCSSQEVSCLTETSFVRVVLDGPVLVSQLPDRNRISCSMDSMRGDTAIVMCEVDLASGGTEETCFALVLEQGEWRIGQPFL